ncbi:unnamed protein product [Closterium sp. NIES-53]
MWIFRVKRPPGSPPVFKARYVARGFSQRQGVDYFQTFSPTPKMTTLRVLQHVAAHRDYELHSLDFSTAFLQGSLFEEIWLRRPPGFTGSFPPGTQWSLRRPVYGLRQAPREWHDTLRTTLAALGFAPSTADPSLFLRTDTSLLPFYILVYVDDLVFATADTAGLAYVKSELQKRHTCTDLGELRSYLGLQITRDRACRTITLTQSHMVQQVLQRFGFTYSSPQATPLPTRHSLSALPSDESVESSGPYAELVGCLMYLMTCTRPDLAYPLSILSRYVAPGRHRLEHMATAKRVLRYLCSTSGMGLVLGGRSPVVLTGHADASWADDQATQRSSQGYTFGLGSVSVSWRATRSSSVLGSSCEAEIYAGAMAAQELRWLTYLLTDLGGDLTREVRDRGTGCMTCSSRCGRSDIGTRDQPQRVLVVSHFLTILPYVPVRHTFALLCLTGLVTPCSPPLCLWGRPAAEPPALPEPPEPPEPPEQPEPPESPKPPEPPSCPTAALPLHLLACPGPTYSAWRATSLLVPAVMATPSLLTFDTEGRAVDFEVWLDDLQLFLQCDRADGLSLFYLTSGVSRAPPATADSTFRSQWATRDAAARLAVRRHLPTTERALFSQYRSAQTLYDAVVARYSSPATAALSRLFLPYLFPDLAAFPIVADLITHLRTSDTRYRAALLAEFCAKNPPPLYLTLYYVVTRLPDSLRVVRDHFLSVCPTTLTVDLLEERLLAAEQSIVAGSLHEEIWLRRPPGFTGSFPPGTQWSLRRPVYGLRQAPREWHDTLRTTLAALGFAPSTADPSLFLRTDTSLPPFYVLVYVDDLVFATADTAGLAHVKSELQKRHTSTDLGELRSYLGLQITRDRAQRTITLTQSHMVQQVLQRFDFTYSSPQATPLSTRHSLSALSSDESVEPSGPYPELVGCLILPSPRSSPPPTPEPIRRPRPVRSPPPPSLNRRPPPPSPPDRSPPAPTARSRPTR